MSAAVGVASASASVLAGMQRQATILRRLPDYASFIAMSPLSTIMFIAIVRSVGRDDLGVTALIGVSIITVWQTGLFVAGETIARDRQMGLFELNLAAPMSLRHVVLGRIVVSTTFSFIPFVLGILVAWLVFGEDVVSIERPLHVVAVLAATWFSSLGALLMMSPIAVLSGRSTALFNGLSYPLFLLAGIVVPVSFLPDWIRPLSAMVFMRWSAEGLRNGASGDGGVLWPIAWLLVTGAVMLVIGGALLTLVLDRMRRTGDITKA